jgi:hypothetical protein
MGSVLPREKLCVEFVPCRMLTREIGSLCVDETAEDDVIDWLRGCGSAVASPNSTTEAAAARPADFRKERRLGARELLED